VKQNTISSTQLCLPHIKHFGYRRISEKRIGWVPGIFPELVEILNHHGFIYLLRLVFCDSPKRGWSRSRTVPGKFLIGGLCVCTGGLDILKIAKISTDLLRFIFQFGGLGALFEGLSPPKYPVATRLPRRTLTYSCRLPMKVCQALNFTGTSMRKKSKTRMPCDCNKIIFNINILKINFVYFLGSAYIVLWRRDFSYNCTFSCTKACGGFE